MVQLVPHQWFRRSSGEEKKVHPKVPLSQSNLKGWEEPRTFQKENTGLQQADIFQDYTTSSLIWFSVSSHQLPFNTHLCFLSNLTKVWVCLLKCRASRDIGRPGYSLGALQSGTEYRYVWPEKQKDSRDHSEVQESHPWPGIMKSPLLLVTFRLLLWAEVPVPRLSSLFFARSR